MARLHPDVLASLPKTVRIPTYDRSKIRTRMLHLGIGAFHRAHQEVYTEDLIAAGITDWGFCGVDLLGPEMRDALAPQDLLYTVATLNQGAMNLRVVGSVRELLVGPEGPEALIERMCDPEIAIVSSTVTEKGYYHDPATGKLNLDHPAIKADLANPDRPASYAGTVVAALKARRARGVPPFTVLSCDNLPENGHTARSVVTMYADALGGDIGEWIRGNVAFPCTMVDRIVPATTPDDKARVAAALGVEDAWPVVGEEFKQWVIEDTFPLGRPAWQESGAEIVSDVVPYEHMKHRLLNGSHSALSYLGYLAGHQHISDCMRQPPFVTYMRRLMDDDMTPTLNVPDVDLGAYKDELVARFINPDIKHRTWQIAMDGTQKLPQRLLEAARIRLSAGASCDHIALAVAAWMRYVGGVDDAGAAIDVRDPMAAALKKIADDTGPNAEALARNYLAINAVFGSELPTNPNFVEPVTKALGALIADGSAKTVATRYGG